MSVLSPWAWRCPSLVGEERLAQLRRLRELADVAWAGHGQLVLVGGEAGSGKSRLIRELREHANAVVLQGASFEPDRTLPFAPIADLLGDFSRRHDPTHPSAAEAGALRARINQTGDADDAERHKSELFEAVLEFVQRLARESAVLVILEDLHWADDMSLDFMRALARRAPELRVLVLISFRPQPISSAASRAVSDLVGKRLATQVTLAPLSRADVADMLQTMSTQHAALTEPLMDRLYALTEGNPFFVEELLSGLRDPWRIGEIQKLPIPRTIQDAVQRRTERLSDSARTALVQASVLGRRFDFRQLSALTGLAEPALVGCVRELMAEGLVVEDSADTFAFRHELTRQAVYADLLARERRALHQRALQVLAASISDPPVEDLAYHAYAAGDWSATFEYAQAAGRRALVLHAPAAAIEHFSHALEACGRLGSATPLGILRRRATAYETLGSFDAARIDLQTMLAAAQSAGDRVAEWQALVDLAFVWSARDYTRTREFLDAAIGVAQGLPDETSLAHSLNRLGNWYMNADAPREAMGYHREALQIFERSNDHAGIASTLDLLGLASLLDGKGSESAEHYTRAMELYRHLDDRRGLATALSMLAWMGNGDPSGSVLATDELATQAEARAREAIALTRSIGWRSGEAFALAQTALLPISAGDYARAFSSARRALRIAEEIDHPQWAAMAHLALAGAYAQLLAIDSATAHCEQAVAAAEACGSAYFSRIARGQLALARIERGQPREAEHILAGMANLTSFADPVHRWLWCVRTELALAQRRPEAALEIVDRLIATAESVGSAPGRVPPMLARARGRVLLDLNRPEPAADAFASAEQVAAQRGYLPVLASVQALLGGALRRQGKRQAAEQAFARARGTIDRIAAQIPPDALAEVEATPLREFFVAAASALLPPPPQFTPTRAAKQAAGGLTAREVQVARLIAAGRSNAEIAATLVLGRRTVETHVASIYGRLGVNSRAEVATWVAEHLRVRAAPGAPSAPGHPCGGRRLWTRPRTARTGASVSRVAFHRLRPEPVQY